MKACITTSHLYGMGGGAKAVFAVASALKHMYGHVTIFVRSQIPELVLDEKPDGMLYASWYEGCALGYDVLFNVDHFHYTKPQAAKNYALIFHPHSMNKPPEGYDMLFSISEYTQVEVERLWGLKSTLLYLPVEDDYYTGVKDKVILHVSRFSAPNQYADKGHRQMITAFKSISDLGWSFILAGSVDPKQAGYLSSLMADASGYDIQFAISPSRKELLGLYANASIYWHATGIGMRKVVGAQEHLGLTTIEAMASGCVPVVYGTGGQKEIVKSGINGILVGSEKDMARATVELTKKLDVWSILQQQAARSGKAWCGLDGFYDRFEEALSGVDNGVPSGYVPSLKYKRSDVDIIIPVWNSTTIHRCLDGIPEGPNVIVVDNGSDNIVEHPRIDKYIRLEENRGFSGGNMAGFAESTRPLVLALNDDCIPSGEMWLDIMLLSMSEEGVGVVGAKLTYPDGRLQHAGVLIDWNREDICFHRWYGGADHPAANVMTKVTAVTGACLLCKRELFDMHPELYKLGNYEDVHLCLSAWMNGYSVIYQPGASLIHIEAVTKSGTDVDYTATNRPEFVRQWRSVYLDSEEMKVVREVNDASGWGRTSND